MNGMDRLVLGGVLLLGAVAAIALGWRIAGASLIGVGAAHLLRGAQALVRDRGDAR